jgi:molybdopterin synthase catalytic subunit
MTQAQPRYDIQIIESCFDPWQLLVDYQQNSMQGRCDYGATASFVGTMRDFNQGDMVSSMVLEHYPAMTQKQLKIIMETCFSRWDIHNALLIHRVGPIQPAEPIVLVAVWSTHRAAAFDACRQLMEDLKHHAPFWKNEQLAQGGQRWVETNT